MKRPSPIPIWQILTSLTIALVSISSFATSHQEAALLQFNEDWVAASEQNILHARCSRTIPLTDREMRDWLDAKANEDGQKISVNIHGIELVDESPYLADLLQALLTQDQESKKPQRGFESSCKKVYCAASALFGERVGLQLLYMMGRFGFNGSHLRVENSSSWTSQELDTVLLALSDLPKELISSTPLTFNHRLIHYQHGKQSPDGSLALASTPLAGPQVYDSWNGYSVAMQRYALFHELGHVYDFASALHDSDLWHQSTSVGPTQPKAVSKYAELSPTENFAESFAAYRYNPEELKDTVPAVYDFMRTNVFKGIEYTEDGTCNNESPEPRETLAALDELKRSILNKSASLSNLSLSDDEIESARQTCLSGPSVVSAFISGKLLKASAQCVRLGEIRKAVENTAGQSVELKGLNAEWLAERLNLKSMAEKAPPEKCQQNCQNLAQKGLGQIERGLELVLVGYVDLENGQDKQSVQKFCSDLALTNVSLSRGYPQIQELTGKDGFTDFVHAATQVCKVVQSKFKKRQSMSSEQIDAALEQIYPI